MERSVILPVIPRTKYLRSTPVKCFLSGVFVSFSVAMAPETALSVKPMILRTFRSIW